MHNARTADDGRRGRQEEEEEEESGHGRGGGGRSRWGPHVPGQLSSVGEYSTIGSKLGMSGGGRGLLAFVETPPSLSTPPSRPPPSPTRACASSLAYSCPSSSPCACQFGSPPTLLLRILKS
ncbi:hypothetical protein BHM03_00059062 [Ensete ventricosum]|nr:hypothetical protein BHM03_00059062 [Ensete ventricosum]